MLAETDAPLNEFDLSEEATQPEERISPLGALIGVIFRPYNTFQRMREAPVGHWWVVAILAVIGVILVVVASIPANAEVARLQFESQREMMGEISEEDMAQIEQMQGMSQNIFLFVGLGFGLVGVIVVYLLHAGLLYLLGLTMGGRASFKQVYRMAVWTTLPAAIRSLVSAVAIFVTGGLPAAGLSFALEGGEQFSSPILTSALGYFDFYRLWMLILIGVGAAATYRLGAGKSFLLVLIYFIVTFGLSLGGGVIQQLAAGMFG